MLDRITYTVQTPKGNIKIHDLHIEDEVYDIYGKRQIIKAIGSEKKRQKIYEITYSDGRKTHFLEDDFIYIGKNMYATPKRLIDDHRKYVEESGFNEMKIGDIESHEVNYEDGIRTPLIPDPYITGALLIYGDYKYDFINLPLDQSQALYFLQIMYQLDAMNPTIIWNDLFRYYKLQAISKDSKDRIFPIEYLKASINDRWQLIRGVFDTGYEKTWTPDQISLMHKDRERLQAVQEILWSMGIYSVVFRNPDPQIPRSNEWRLDVSYQYEQYARFFYNIGLMEHQLSKEKDHPVCHFDSDPFKLSIIKIEIVGTGFTNDLILENGNILFLTDNFLPRISI